MKLKEIVIGVCISGLIIQLSYLVLTNIPHGTTINFKPLSVLMGGVLSLAYILGYLTARHIGKQNDGQNYEKTLDGHLTKNKKNMSYDEQRISDLIDGGLLQEKRQQMKPILKIKRTNNGMFLITDEPVKAGEYRYNMQRDTIHVADKDGIEYYNKRSDVYKRAIWLDEDAPLFSIKDIRKTFERGMAVNIYLANFQTEEEYSRLLIELMQSK